MVSLTFVGKYQYQCCVTIKQARAPPRSFVWGDRFMGTQTNLPPRFIFSSNFGHFILKMLDHAKLLYVSRKKLLKYHNLGGRPSLIYRLRGTCPPSPPPRFRHPWNQGNVISGQQVKKRPMKMLSEVSIHPSQAQIRRAYQLRNRGGYIF